MGVDLRIYLGSKLSDNSLWCNSTIDLARDYDVWDHIEAKKLAGPVPTSIEVYTYGADGDTKFVLDRDAYGNRITCAEPKELGCALVHSHSLLNQAVGHLLMSLPKSFSVILYWH